MVRQIRFGTYIFLLAIIGHAVPAHAASDSLASPGTLIEFQKKKPVEPETEEEEDEEPDCD